MIVCAYCRQLNSGEELECRTCGAPLPVRHSAYGLIDISMSCTTADDGLEKDENPPVRSGGLRWPRKKDS